MSFDPKIAATMLAAGLLLAGASHANPAGAPPSLSSRPPSVSQAPPNLSFEPPSVTPAPPNVTPAPPFMTPAVPNIIVTPRRCRTVYRTDSFGFLRRIRRCR